MNMGEINMYFSVLVQLLIISTSVADIVVRRKGGIIRVDPQCDPSPLGVSVITVYADFPVVVEMFCNGGHVARPNTVDGVTYRQLVGNNAITGLPCLFLKKVKSTVYTIEVRVALASRSPDVAVRQAREDFIVTCSYDESAEDETSHDRIDVTKHVFDEVIHNMGPPMEDTQILLEVVDVEGTPIADNQVPLGRIIKLRAKVSGKELVRPVNCIVTSGEQLYRILLGGCGDGLVFNKNVGFRIRGNIIDSPYFVAFRLSGQKSMVFKCNFTACSDKSACDGSSCYKQNGSRRKRSEDYSLVFEASKTIDSTYSPDISGISSPLTSGNSYRQRRSICDVIPYTAMCRHKSRIVHQ